MDGSAGAALALSILLLSGAPALAQDDARPRLTTEAQALVRAGRTVAGCYARYARATARRATQAEVDRLHACRMAASDVLGLPLLGDLTATEAARRGTCLRRAAAQVGTAARALRRTERAPAERATEAQEQYALARAAVNACEPRPSAASAQLRTGAGAGTPSSRPPSGNLDDLLSTPSPRPRPPEPAPPPSIGLVLADPSMQRVPSARVLLGMLRHHTAAIVACRERTGQTGRITVVGELAADGTQAISARSDDALRALRDCVLALARSVNLPARQPGPATEITIIVDVAAPVPVSPAAAP